jgi:hypothetical protein
MVYKIKRKSKPRSYSVLTTNSNRIEVKAYNVLDAYRKAKKELIKFHKKDMIGLKKDEDLTSAYETYGREGISEKGFVITPKSIEAHKKHNLGKSKKTPLEVLYGKVVIGGI